MVPWSNETKNTALIHAATDYLQKKFSNFHSPSYCYAGVQLRKRR
jgi:hypothetical protein